MGRGNDTHAVTVAVVRFTIVAVASVDGVAGAETVAHHPRYLSLQRLHEIAAPVGVPQNAN